VRGIEGVSPECRGVPSAGATGKAADTPPIHDTLDRSLDQSNAVEVTLAKALAEAAAAGRYDVVLQLARRLDTRQLDTLRREREGGGLKVIKGGSGASGAGER
jgi:hypothetical protein